MCENIPTVSVVLPTYQRAKVVGRAIRSVLGQTYQDFEIILVDDGSTDNTEEVVKGFNDQHVRYIRHEKNKGSAAARNTGLKASKGVFIAFQDSDDEWLPEKLEKQMQVFENVPAGVGIVYTDMWRIHRDEREYWHSSIIRPEDGIVYNEALVRLMGIGIQTALVRRECFDKAGVFDERLHRFIDLELFIRLSKYYHFYHVNEPLVKYYEMEKSLSSDNEALVKAFEFIFQKHYHDMAKNRRSLAKCLYFIGNAMCKSRNLDHGKNYLFKAAKTYPVNIEYVVAAFVSLLGQNAYISLAKLRGKISQWLEGYVKR